MFKVSCGWKEPFPGYTEGLQSLNGLFVVSGRGVLRTALLNNNEPLNLIPVDIVVNALIISARNRAIQITEDVLYFNVTETMDKETPWKNYLDRSLYKISYKTQRFYN